MLQTLEVRPNAVLVSKIEEIDVRVHLCESNLEEDEYTTFIAKVEEFQQNDIQNLKDGVKICTDAFKKHCFFPKDWVLLSGQAKKKNYLDHMSSVHQECLFLLVFRTTKRHRSCVFGLRNLSKFEHCSPLLSPPHKSNSLFMT